MAFGYNSTQGLNVGVDQPLLRFSTTEERASVHYNSDDDGFESDDSMVARRRRRAGGRRPAKRSKKRGHSAKGVRVSKGTVKLRVKGYKGLQSLRPSELVRQIPASKLKVAARKVLGPPARRRRRRKGGKRRSRKSGRVGKRRVKRRR